MNGDHLKNNEPDVIQFLLLGSSQGHVLPVIDNYNTSKIVLFSSEDLKTETEDFSRQIEKEKGIQCEIILLDPFGSSSLFEMVKEILHKAEEYEKKKEELKPIIVAGVTGGTNLMAIAMALASLVKGWACHYVLKQIKADVNDFVLEIDIFKELNQKIKSEDWKSYFFAEVRS
jgi:hypothetical protein